MSDWWGWRRPRSDRDHHDGANGRTRVTQVLCRPLAIRHDGRPTGQPTRPIPTSGQSPDGAVVGMPPRYRDGASVLYHSPVLNYASPRTPSLRGSRTHFVTAYSPWGGQVARSTRSSSRQFVPTQCVLAAENRLWGATEGPARSPSSSLRRVQDRTTPGDLRSDFERAPGPLTGR